jgi:hypothetical protein
MLCCRVILKAIQGSYHVRLRSSNDLFARFAGCRQRTLACYDGCSGRLSLFESGYRLTQLRALSPNLPFASSAGAVFVSSGFSALTRFVPSLQPLSPAKSHLIPDLMCALVAFG